MRPTLNIGWRKAEVRLRGGGLGGTHLLAETGMWELGYAVADGRRKEGVRPASVRMRFSLPHRKKAGGGAGNTVESGVT